MAAEKTGLSKYIDCKPACGDAVVKSSRTTFYFLYAHEAFYAAVDTYLVEATWMNHSSLENNTNTIQTFSPQHTTQLRITKGEDVTKFVNIGAEFEDLSICMGGSTKTFSKRETTSETKTLTVNVAPRTRTTFYQRRYRFKVAIYFILDASSKEWIINVAGKPKQRLTKECTVEIMSEDYLVTDTELSNAAVGTFVVKTVPQTNVCQRFGGSWDRKDLSDRAERALTQAGI